MASHFEVARRWAERPDKPGARELHGHHMYEADGALYSYGRHFCVARWIQLPSDEWIAFFNPQSYSVSTQRHKSIARQAFRRFANGRQSFTNPFGYDQAALEYYTNCAREEDGKAARARVHGYMHRQRAAELCAERDALAAIFARFTVAA